MAILAVVVAVVRINLLKKIQKLKQEVAKVIVGQNAMIDALLVGIFSHSHVLLEGVPGVAKTTAIKTIASTLGLDFGRIQFTPDLLPSDLIGSEIYDLKKSEFRIKKGPIFTNLLLADEINRAPSKVQSALLEAMQEKQVSIGDKSFLLDEPFFVLATQNPIENEGVYALPEAQLDRFMLKVFVSYPSKEDELEIIRKFGTQKKISVAKVLDKNDIAKIYEAIDDVHVDEQMQEYIVDLIDASRNDELLHYGASVRASLDLLRASKAYAFLKGKDYIAPSDVALCIKDVLRHRIVLSYEAQAKGISPDEVITSIMQRVDVP